MAIDITNPQLNTVITEEYKKKDSSLPVPTETETTDDAWLLSLTSRFAKNGLSQVERIMTAEDVYSGAVEKEIDNILSEEDQIASILKENTNALNAEAMDTLTETLRANTAKTIGFVEYTAKSKINATTDTTSIKNSIVANNEEEKQLLYDAIDVMVEWLDDYIANYNVRVAQGKAAGQSELKLSFLLEIRKAIENCDFKVGFGTVGNGADDNFTPTDNAMGAYTPNLQYYTNDGSLVGYDTYHLNAPSRNILLNPSYFMPERKYSSADEIEAAILSGNTEFNYPDLLVDDEAFYNYCKVNLAQTLWHELIHSTHIYNECVTYYSTDTMEDDFAKQLVEGVSNETLAVLKTYFNGFENGVTYESVGVTHDFDTYSDVIAFAWKQMSLPAPDGNKEAFDAYMPGVTQAIAEGELKNFLA